MVSISFYLFIGEETSDGEPYGQDRFRSWPDCFVPADFGRIWNHGKAFIHRDTGCENL